MTKIALFMILPLVMISGTMVGRPVVSDVAWSYSTDGGKTFTGRPAATQGPVVAKATFHVADPSAVSGVYVTLPGKDPGITRGGKSEWKCPVLLDSTVELNGKPAGYLPSPWIVYDRVELEPADLVKGENLLTVRGDHALPGWPGGHDDSHHKDPITMKLEAMGVEAAALQSGPVVGAFGPDFVTICCRTNGAGVRVSLTAKTDTGKDITQDGKPGLFHRFHVEVPAGTRAVTYTLNLSVGDARAADAVGPFTIRLPDWTSGRLRFAVAGDSDGGGWRDVAAKILEKKADFLVHAGGMNYFPILNDRWTGIFENAAPLHAVMPTYAVRGFRDDGSFEFDNLFYRPTADGKGDNWTQVLGPVRLIGVGLDGWDAGTPNLKWLDETLASAKEDFVFVFFHAAAYSSDESFRPPLTGLRKLSRELVAPMLARHKVTAMISGNSHGYERSEPGPDKGVTQLVAGASGGTIKHRPSGRADGNNGFLKVYKGTTHYMLFEVDGKTCRLRVLGLDGTEIDTVDFKARD